MPSSLSQGRAFCDVSSLRRSCFLSNAKDGYKISLHFFHILFNYCVHCNSSLSSFWSEFLEKWLNNVCITIYISSCKVIAALVVLSVALLVVIVVKSRSSIIHTHHTHTLIAILCNDCTLRTCLLV